MLRDALRRFRSGSVDASAPGAGGFGGVLDPWSPPGGSRAAPPFPLRLLDAALWRLSLPADRRHVHAARLRGRQENLARHHAARALAMLRGRAPGPPPWLAPEPAGGRGGASKPLTSPPGANASGGGAYDPARDYVWIKDDDLADNAFATARDLGPLRAVQPGRLVFEHVIAPDPADGLGPILRHRARVAGLLSARRPPEACRATERFLAAWPRIPARDAGRDGRAATAGVPLSAWAACLWTDRVDGAARLFRQPLGPDGVPVGPARSWALDLPDAGAAP